MVNIVLETNCSRPRLLEQTLRTLCQNTPKDQFTLVIVQDGRHEFPPMAMTNNNTWIASVWPPCSVTGRLKNLGAYWSEKQFGRGEWLLFIDDDVAFLPGWLKKMQKAWEWVPRVGIVGGCQHPYHGYNEWVYLEASSGDILRIADAVAGYSMLMRWETFDKYGPFAAVATGIGQSEDFAFARRIVEDGGKVGYIHPPVLYHTGVTNSSGQPATGAEKIERVPGILYL